jgi:hypothetical protein
VCLLLSTCQVLLPSALDELGKVDRRAGCAADVDSIPSQVENSAATATKRNLATTGC